MKIQKRNLKIENKKKYLPAFLLANGLFPSNPRNLNEGQTLPSTLANPRARTTTNPLAPSTAATTCLEDPAPA